MEKKNIYWMSSHKEIKDLMGLVKGLGPSISLRANRRGDNYTGKDEWDLHLEKMGAFEFIDISFERMCADGTWKKENLGYPMVINAFNPLQAERIFEWTMYSLVSRIRKGSADGMHFSLFGKSFIRGLSYRLGRAWPKWDGCRIRYQGGKKGQFSDCDPDHPKWGGNRDLYEGMVVRCLAFQRGLIPEEERAWFGNLENAAEVFPSDYDPEWKPERIGEFDWVSMDMGK